MANTVSNTILIDQTNSGFPGYLDFDALRTSSIQYLSSLTGKVWTDYNVHDPGITILEALIYALLDLGYRTSLPAKDIFTRNPDEAGDNDNFFTPAQILSCNPVTTTDFRKMLVDINGIKNAWVEVAEDMKLEHYCAPPSNPDGGPAMAVAATAAACTSFINGLYHISLQLDDFPVRTQEDVIAEVKTMLLSHRNLCEDFIDMAVLCGLKIGVCADIGLKPGADAEEVCRNILLALESYFSPAPKFYTLQQLLDKGKKIEDIFAGRPYNIENSNGFVDTDEFEAIEQKKEIHLSDVYNVILSVDGVETVKKLKLKKEGLDFIEKWEYIIPTNFLPVFSTANSSMQFSVNGIAVPLDFEKISGPAAALAGNSTKLARQKDDMDLVIPRGQYHNDLANYYSIQNEFPLLYGIGEGGLSATASLQRQAQALQLKGYLLFFDQLLANYLTQLSNTRHLFSFKSPAANAGHSYFVNSLNTVPDMQKLLLNVSDEKGNSAAGSNGKVLGYPVWKHDFEKLLQQESYTSADIRKLQQTFTCRTQHQYQVIAAGLQTNFKNQELFSIAAKRSTADKYGFYTAELAASDILLLGELFAEPDNNTTAAVAALYAFNLLPGMGIIPANYNSFSTGNGTVSFNIQLNLLTYPQYLAQVAEDKTQYLQRRDGFLNHLLSRFAEQFSDFALLSYHFMEKDKLQGIAIQHKESFLTNYPLLSSTRGKAFDYRATAADNLSGFEKRFKAYTGIESGCCTSLCNFEVAEYKNTYSVQLKLAGIHLFSSDDTLEGLDSAQLALGAIFSAIADPKNHRLHHIMHEGKYQLQVVFNNTEVAYYPVLFAHDQEALAVSERLQQIFTAGIKEEEIIVSSNEYRLVLRDSEGNPVRISVAASDNEATAFAASVASLHKPGDAAVWQIISTDNTPSGKFCSNDKKKPEKLIDYDAFKIDVNDTIVGKPGKFNYELLDKPNHTFKFGCLGEFNSEKLARADAYRLLMLMADKENYQVTPDKRKKIFILNHGQPVAECLNKIDNGRQAAFIDKVHDFISKHFYRLSADPFPNRWKFICNLGFEKDADLRFESVVEFDKAENAKTAAIAFSDALENSSLEVVDTKYSLLQAGAEAPVLTCTHVGKAIEALNEEEKLAKAKQLLELNKQVSKRLHAATPQPFEEGIQIDKLSNTGAFVYRLVDKDNLYAKHIVEAPGTPDDVKINGLYHLAQSGYAVLNICLGGDITEAVKDGKKGIAGYRYIIRCHHDFGPFKHDNILFKSVSVYAAVDEAETAFNNNYLHILNKAMDAANYGPGQYISLEEPATAKTNAVKKDEATVFVPKEIQELLTSTEADIIQTLVETAKSYPVRLLLKCSPDDKKYYSETSADCVDITGDCADDSNIDCSKTTARYYYYFSLYNAATSSEDWRSVQLYSNPQEARQAFYYFMMLLNYKGNYTSAKDDNNATAIFIREVLAESKSRFKEEDDAWGAQGIEKFICLAQAPDAFHSVLRPKQCDYSFNVACNTANGIHPCKYESPAKRDEVLEKLFTAIKNFDTSKLFKIIDENGVKILYGINGNKLAVLPGSNNTTAAGTACHQIINILGAAGNEDNYNTDNGKLTLYKDEIALAEAAEPGIPKLEWKKQLLLLAYYFPVQWVNQKYCVEIRLPGFNTADNNDNKVIPGCAAPPPVTEAEDACYVAWQGDCCYNDCDTAFIKWQAMLAVLSDYENYRPYFDCTCYSYGIGLQTATDIVATSPQHYSSPEMLCDAIKRSKKLINCEGLNLVEHILLRPRVQGDCACTYTKPGNFAAETLCTKLFWKEERFVKGFEETHNICFTPGEDPFSFIATVVMPAWPERFRKKENRDLLEMMLYREAPAHVLLRILWLNPQDTCTFESPYKKWKKALLQKDPATIEAAACSLMGFIMGGTLHCLSECNDCLPCTNTTVSLECAEDKTKINKPLTSIEKLNAINQLFGFKPIPCDIQKDNDANRAAMVQNPVAAAAAARALTREEARFINVRLKAYNENILRIYLETGGNQLAKDAGSVLTGTDANPLGGTKNLLAQKDPAEEINRLLLAMLDTENAANDVQLLSQTQKEGLIKNLVWFYLDKSLIEDKSIDSIALIATGLDKMRASNFDMRVLFTEWKPADIEKYESPDTINAVWEMLVKNKA